MALGAASVASSMAQVYSANAVGYVNLTVQPGYNLISNPLNGTNNHLNTILPLTDAATDDGTIIWRFRPGTQNYGNAITWFGTADGWLAADEPQNSSWYVLDPGEGVFLFYPGPSPRTITFVGEVPQGALSKPVLGANNYSILASQVPQALPLGTAGTANTLMFPATLEDVVFIFNPVTQSYKDGYTYFGGTDGWVSANVDDPGPLGPTIPVGTSFFVLKSGALNQAWTRNFTVN